MPDENRILADDLIQQSTQFRFGPVRIDWLKPMLPLYSNALVGASELTWTEGRTVRVASAEGLILTKMVAFRLQDQVDIVTLLAANRDEIDTAMIRNEWAPYAPTEVERSAWLEGQMARIVPAPRAE